MKVNAAQKGRRFRNRVRAAVRSRARARVCVSLLAVWSTCNQAAMA